MSPSLEPVAHDGAHADAEPVERGGRVIAGIPVFVRTVDPCGADGPDSAY